MSHGKPLYSTLILARVSPAWQTLEGRREVGGKHGASEVAKGMRDLPLSSSLLNTVMKQDLRPKRPFPISPGPLFQNEGRCSAFDMEIIFHSHANKTHFLKKGCAPSLTLKVRVFGTRKWPTERLSTLHVPGSTPV